MDKLLTIGEVSKYKHITIKTLRYYHEQGIIIPKHIDNTTGYRYYSKDQFILIDVIKGCKELGATTKELKYISSLKDTKLLFEVLVKKQEQARQNILKMQKVIDDIDYICTKVENNKNYFKNNEIRILEFEERYVASTKTYELGKISIGEDCINLDSKLGGVSINEIYDAGLLCYTDDEFKIEKSFVSLIINSKKAIEISAKDVEIINLKKGRYIVYGFEEKNREKTFKKIKNYMTKNNLKSNMYIEIELVVDVYEENSQKYELQILINE